MNIEPLISVIIPVYNGEKYIYESVKSILDQSYSNLEVIIVNDGSSDGTKTILTSFKNDKRVVILDQENKGLVFSLNRAIREAKGEYIARMDADDISLKSRLKLQLEYLLENGLDIVGSWVSIFNEDGKKETIAYPELPKDNNFMLNFKSTLAHPSVMMKKDVFEFSLYSTNAVCEDYDLWCNFASSGFKIGNVPRVLLNYREHPNQITSTKQAALYSSLYLVRQSYANVNSMGGIVKKEIALHNNCDFKEFCGVVDLVYNRSIELDISPHVSMEILNDIYLNCFRKNVFYYIKILFVSKRLMGKYNFNKNHFVRSLFFFGRDSFLYRIIKEFSNEK